MFISKKLRTSYGLVFQVITYYVLDLRTVTDFVEPSFSEGVTIKLGPVSKSNIP